MCLALRWSLLVFILQNRFPVEANSTTTDYDLEETTNTTESNDSLSETTEISNLSLILKFATECETPNHDPGICIGIKECPVLMKELLNNEARNFLKASQCGFNEEHNMPNVCCGKFGNYKNASSFIDEDINIFPKKCGRRQVVIMRSRILGGVKASMGEFPWMARLVHKNKKGHKSIGCSGFLIHTKYVLTAAHCVHPNHTVIRGPLYSVILGEHDIRTKIDCNPSRTYCADPLQISRVAKVIVHPEYRVESSGHYNDIALVHIKKAARITDFVAPICLQSEETEESLGPLFISGWGKTEEEMFSSVKMKLEVPAVKKSVCVEKYQSINIELKDSQICAGGEEGKDSCSGDSGGPLMAENETNYYAVGIVSYGLGCGNKGWPGVYTNIPSFYPWIKRQIIINSIATKSPKTKRHNQKKSKGKGYHSKPNKSKTM